MAEPLYLPPEGSVLQGDIYTNLPALVVEDRPLRAARPFQIRGKRDLWGVHREDGHPPQGGFKWTMEQGGEKATLVHAYLEMAMVVSHDCEIENDPRHRTLAIIRPMSHLDPDAQKLLLSGVDDDRFVSILPLDAQTEEPKMSLSFVDFRRLTTVRAAVLNAGTRHASVSEELRKAIARRFWLYLFRRVDAAGAR